MRSSSVLSAWSSPPSFAPSTPPHVAHSELAGGILVVAQNGELRQQVAQVLQSQGLSPILLEDVSQIATALVLTPIDLALVLVGSEAYSLPALCDEVHTVRPTMPLFILSDNASEEEHVAALRAGADDYLPTAVPPRLLVARIQSALRRVGLLHAERLEYGGIVVELGSHRVFADGHEIDLTSTEYRLVQLFLRNPGRVFTRRHLLDNIWNVPADVVTRTVDTHVKRLRQKLGASGASIETVRGIGYRCGQGVVS